jgi:transketolase
MRTAFVQALVEAGERDPSIVLLTGDLGFMALEPFAERFPGRFYNCGVSEQNMVGTATGLAEAGLRPFVYSIATFASMRPFEFIRNGPLQHRLPVCVVGIGGGMDYGPNGASHYAIEDVALMRTHPEMGVLVPADPAQAARATHVAASLDGPAYLRLEKGSGLSIPELAETSVPGAARIGQGDDVLLVAMGGLASEALAAAELLAADGIAASTLVVSGFNPSPIDQVVDALADVRVALTVEAHMINGGLGSFVCEAAAEDGLSTRIVRCGLRRMPRGSVGSRDHMLAQHGLSASAIAATVRDTLLVAS